MGQLRLRTPFNGRKLLQQGVRTFKHKLVSHQQAIDTVLVEEIRMEAKAMLKQDIAPLPLEIFNLFQQTGSRKEYENLYFARRKQLTALGLMAIIEPEQPQYLEKLTELLQEVCTEFTWCLPAHFNNEQTIDLFAAETAFTLAELGELLRDRLPESLLATMKDEVYQRVLHPFIEQKHVWWEGVEHNWASVCAGSIGAAALYYMVDDERLPMLLDRVVRAMECYLHGFQQDGVCAEGYGYWQYGFGYFVYFADLLHAHTNGEINLFAADKVEQIALFQQKCFIGGKHVVNFSDSPASAGVFMGLTHYLHQLFEQVTIPLEACRASFNEDHCGRWAPAVRNLLWLQNIQGTAWQAASYPLEQAQWLISTIHQNENMVSFAAKGGHNDEPHNHNDLGHFIVAINGKSLLCDLGSGLYTKEYFGEGRYSYICTSSAGHSVPIICGAEQRPGAEAQAKLLELTVGEQYDEMSLELSRAYPAEQLTAFTRTFTWDKSIGQLILTEQLEFTKLEREDITVTERLIASSKPYLLEENCLAIDSTEGSLYIRFDSEQLDWSSEAFRYIDHFNKEAECYRIDFQVKQTTPSVSIKLHISVHC